MAVLEMGDEIAQLRPGESCGIKLGEQLFRGFSDVHRAGCAHFFYIRKKCSLSG